MQGYVLILRYQYIFLRGLGPTVPELELEKYGVKVLQNESPLFISYFSSLQAHPKSCFTMVLPDLMAELKEKQPETK